MRTKAAICLIIFALIWTNIQSALCANIMLLDNSYLRTYAETRGFMLGRPVKAKPTPDGTAVLFLRATARQPQQSLYIFDIASGQTKELLTPQQVLKGAEEHLSAEEKARRERQRVSVGGFTDFQISDDSARILLSLSGKLYVITRATGDIKQLNTGDKDTLDPKFSPDSKYVSYVQNNDIHILDIAMNRPRQVTTGGTESVPHGLAEFVAQEELARFSGYWWAPNSKSIVFEEYDAKPVETWYISDPQNPNRVPTPSFYPRPGKANVNARLGITSLEVHRTVWIDWDSKKMEYLADVVWTKNSPLTLVVLNREQKELQLLTVDPLNGKTTEILKEKDNDWINLQRETPLWLKDGSAFLWVSERSGAHELELRDRKGQLTSTLVGKDEGFLQLLDCAGTAFEGSVYYLASTDPTQAHLCTKSIKGGAASKLTSAAGQHYASFSNNHSVYVLESSLLSSMPEISVHKTNGTKIGTLPSVAEAPPVVPKVELVRLGGEHNFSACLIRPQNFEAGKKYPVLLDVYGGPHKIKVVATERNFLLDQWLADQGFIVVSIDGRGTPGRGRDWERAISKKFGSVPLEDQVAGLKELAKKYPELDESQIGVTGWSFGGYMSALAVLRRPDVFKAAVAGAPVVDWLDYDTCYTERYLGLPEKNPEAYKEGDLLTYAAGLKRPLLLVHGTTDDNVFFRHSLKLADALFRSGREFGILPLSGLTHMVPDPVVMEQLWTRIVNHLKENLPKGR
jgi:dipeptidyl-peptidase-4